MKLIKPSAPWPARLGVVLVLTLIGLSSQPAHATPFASGVTNDNGTIRFIMNEAGADVTVTFEDASTLAMGVLPKGATNFLLGVHTGYSIACVKIGNGIPTLISTDSFTNSVWNSPRGVTANKNPKAGNLFGRLYVGNSAAGGTVGTTYKGLGLYAFNADQSDALGQGTNAMGTTTFAGSGGSGPWRIRVAPDNTLLVDDFSTPGAALWQFQPDLSTSNLVLAIVGQTAAAAAGIHGDFFGTPLMTGSLAQGNLVLWTADSGMAVPSASIAPSIVLGPGTSRGSFNCLFRYDIGAGPLPWNHPPNYAYTVGLDGIAELRTEVDIGKDGKIIGGFGRANLSNGNIQILDSTGSTVLYDSLVNNGGTDPWNGLVGNNSQVGTYCGVRVSPDGRFLASVDINNAITVANLVNGLPDDGSIFGIPNTPAVGNSRGMDWDAGDNIWVASSGQGLLRCYSLGVTAKAVTTNDFTGTNGGFSLVLPNITASIVATTPVASQNYTNNTTSPGGSIPGVFTISLTTNFLSAPATVTFVNSGTATGPWAPFTTGGTNNYYMNVGTDGNGITLTTNTVVFPAGTSPSGNWSKAIQIFPTRVPISGPTYTVGMRLIGGASYLAGTPSSATVYIQNTGPQLLVLSAATTGTTFNRAITNDFARFVVTRLGDTNGPNNSAAGINPLPYTVTNVNYGGTASFPLDYTARAQRTDPAGNGVVQVPVDGSPGIVFNPGDVAVTAVIGNPVFHANIFAPPTNVTAIVNLTNVTAIGSPPSTTNVLSLQGTPYSVTTAATTLTEIDNRVLPEVVLWSNPLTNSVDSTNWTLTFASQNLDPAVTVLPVVIPKYTNNNAYSVQGGGTNDFQVDFGNPIASDSIPQSPVMAANGWNTALRMTVNKNQGTAAGVNVYPQGTNFIGNYALRFNMYLSIYSGAINNQFVNATLPREFALFGINHYGTNCNWRLTTPISGANPGNGTTNADGVWFAVDAGIGSATPADFDAFAGSRLPNPGINASGPPNEPVSNTGASQSGLFKHPPFVSINPAGAGGTPINQWVDVSVEVTRQTNVSLLIDRAAVLTSFSITNGGNYTNGVPMLGYLDPVPNQSDNTAFAYFSNVRVVELSPYIITQAIGGLIVTQGYPSITLTSSAWLATAPITNQWFRGTTNLTTSVPLTNTLGTTILTANTTNLTSSMTISNIQSGTNFMPVFSDVAGAVIGTPTVIEVIAGPANRTASAGANVTFTVTPTGQAPPTSFQWQTNGVNLTTNAHFNGVRTATLTITNVQSTPDGTSLYSCVVVDALGTVTTPQATLTVSDAPTSAVVAPASQTNLWGSTASFTVSAVGSGPFTYQWRTNGINLTNSVHYGGATNSALFITNLTRADAGSYTAAVTNSAGGVISSAGVLAVSVPPPTITAVSLAGTNVVMSFTSPNGFDTTNAFTLLSCGVVNGTYTNAPGASYTFSGGVFQVTAPQTGRAMFYKLLHVY